MQRLLRLVARFGAYRQHGARARERAATGMNSSRRLAPPSCSLRRAQVRSPGQTSERCRCADGERVGGSPLARAFHGRDGGASRADRQADHGTSLFLDRIGAWPLPTLSSSCARSKNKTRLRPALGENIALPVSWNVPSCRESIATAEDGERQCAFSLRDPSIALTCASWNCRLCAKIRGALDLGLPPRTSPTVSRAGRAAWRPSSPPRGDGRAT